eukprot:TRINITY_DN10588_c0_g1_i1.p1 TRINITY_DN10588_c0_g1~~TRINITY_DN10588_c0_g1_i1.p1  ORF type:complete len:283 (+),score=58.26 TRINITY_DN10588_c0_g1_i1:96-851(+)
MSGDAADVIVFLDVDGVLHPLAENHLPRDACVEALCARVDEETARSDEEPLYDYGVVDGEFTEENMACLTAVFARVPQARVVLTTTWRERPWGKKAVVTQLRGVGLPPSALRVVGEAEDSEARRRREALPYVISHDDEDGEELRFREIPPYDFPDDSSKDEYYTRFNVDATPTLYPSRRGAEIAAYLAGRVSAGGAGVRYAIIDDAELEFKGAAAPLAPHFVHVDPRRGLTDADVDRVVGLLGVPGAVPVL